MKRASDWHLTNRGLAEQATCKTCWVLLLAALFGMASGLGQRSGGDDPEEQISIGEIRFEGNRVFTDSELLETLQWVGIGSVYQPARLESDLQANLLALYRNRGYIEARVGRPRVKITKETRRGRAHNAQESSVSLTVPIEEGRQYRYHSFQLTGVTAFKPETVNPIYAVKPGDVVNLGAILEANDRLQRLYQGWAYLDMEIMPREEHDEAAGVLDLTVEVQEGHQYIVRGVAFNFEEEDRTAAIMNSGENRESEAVQIPPEVENAWLLKQGQPFNIELLELSLDRLNQLGQFEKIETENCTLIKSPQSAEVEIAVQLKRKAPLRP